MRSNLKQIVDINCRKATSYGLKKEEYYDKENETDYAADDLPLPTDIPLNET